MSSKLSVASVRTSVKEVMAESAGEKKRNFIETYARPFSPSSSAVFADCRYMPIALSSRLDSRTTTPNVTSVSPEPSSKDLFDFLPTRRSSRWGARRALRGQRVGRGVESVEGNRVAECQGGRRRDGGDGLDDRTRLTSVSSSQAPPRSPSSHVHLHSRRCSRH
jgi:hypothetical protein